MLADSAAWATIHEVIPTIIAGIWVAFFSRCQRYRCWQVVVELIEVDRATAALAAEEADDECEAAEAALRRLELRSAATEAQLREAATDVRPTLTLRVWTRTPFSFREQDRLGWGRRRRVQPGLWRRHRRQRPRLWQRSKRRRSRRGRRAPR